MPDRPALQTSTTGGVAVKQPLRWLHYAAGIRRGLLAETGHGEVR